MITGSPVNILDFGADPTNTTDSTTAINLAIAYAITFNGEVLFPSGTYKVTDTIQMFCSGSGNGVNLIGQGAGRTSDGRATLSWRGSSTTKPILQLRAANNCIIDNINILSPDIDTYPHLGGIFVQSGQNFGTGSSSGVQIRNCSVTGGTGVGSYAVKLGEDNLQVSECFLENVFTTAAENVSSVKVTEYGFVVYSNNTRDMTFLGCNQGFFTEAGVYYPAGMSGWHVWENIGGGSSKRDFYVTGNGNLTIIGGGSEASKKALVQVGGGSNPGTITMRGYQAELLEPADAYFIEMGVCNLVLDGCTFSMGAATIKYIKYGDGSLSNNDASRFQAVVSTSNWYREATDFIPVWSFGPINQTITGSGFAPVNVFSTGDTGGAPGYLVRLKTVYGANPQRFASLSYAADNWVTARALPYSTSVLSVATVIQKYTIPYTYLKDASTTANIAFLSIKAKGKVVGVYANVTQAFVLAASSVALAVGYGGSSNEFLLAKTVTGFTGSVGTANGDLGTALAIATIVQGGYVVFTGTTTVTARFTSTSANSGTGTATSATAGSVDIYVAVQDFA
jgi:hypothetical protein